MVGGPFDGSYKTLHFVFEGWMGDQLVQSVPVFLATEDLTDEFSRRKLTGFEAAEVVVERDERWKQRQPAVDLPKFVWFKVNGVHGQSDFFEHDGVLVVSDEALEVILATKPTMLEYGPFEDSE